MKQGKNILYILILFLFSLMTHAQTTNTSAQEATHIQPNWYDNFIFKDKSFIFQFIRTLGYAYSGAADLGESIATAKAIQDGNIDSWYQQWLNTATRLNKMADQMQSQNHIVSAREAFFRASNYYRTAGFYMDAAANREKSIETYKKSKSCFLKGIQSLPYVKYIQIPYERTTLPGYLLRSSVKNAPLLIVQTGFDGTAEELYFQVGLAAHARGYNVLIFEGPGQGSVLREQKLPFRYDWNKVVTPAIDYVMTLPNIDKNKIALLGISMGGYLAPRAAAFDKRITACIANPGLFDFEESVSKNMPANLLELLASNPDEFNKIMYAEMKKNSTSGWFFNHAMWVFDAKSPAHVMTIIKQYSLKNVAENIACPTLVVSGVADEFDKNGVQSKQLYDALKSQKSLLVFTREETAQAHCQMGAIAISNEYILNWLDNILKKGGRPL